MRELQSLGPETVVLHNGESVPFRQRFLRLENVTQADGRKVWTMEKAKREVDEVIRRRELKTRMHSVTTQKQSDVLVPVDDDKAKQLAEPLGSQLVEDDSWMNDSSGVLGGNLDKSHNERKKKKKRLLHSRHQNRSHLKSLQTCERPDTPGSPRFTSEYDIASDDEVASDLGIDVLVAAKVPVLLANKTNFSNLSLTPQAPFQVSNHAILAKDDHGKKHSKESSDAIHALQPAKRRRRCDLAGDVESPATVAPLSMPSKVGQRPSSPIQDGVLDTHPNTGKDIVILTGPRPRPPYERSVFVSG